VYTCEISGRQIKIIFGLFGDISKSNLEKYDEYASFIYSWLFICYKFTSRICAKKLDVHIYLTPLKKNLPNREGTILGANEVNTAFTYGCQPTGKIVLYRNEEWKKVFIHETFHTFGFDFNKHSAKDIYSYINKIFPLQSNFNIEEAYVETWARIMSAAYNSYYSQSNKLDKEEFLTYMKFSLQLERIFSLHQLNKVLEHMGLTYELLCDTSEQSVATCKHLYREKSNILAYYIISGIILNDYYGFLLWCYTNNTHLFQFNASNVTIASFIELIDKGYKTDELINVLQNLRKKNRGYFIENTTRMSAIEVIYK